jgi:hypothetical protein
MHCNTIGANRKTASRRSLQNPIRCFDQAAPAAVFFLLRQPSISISDSARSPVARAFGYRFHHAVKAEFGGLLPRPKLAEGLEPLRDIAGGGRGTLNLVFGMTISFPGYSLITLGPKS